MTEGIARIDYTWPGWFFAGWGNMALFFRIRAQRKQSQILGRSRDRKALRCPSCDTVILIGDGVGNAP
jgi:hypothetical protein